MSGPPLDAVLQDVHACPQGLTCRPGRGVLYPAATRGRLAADVPDVMLLGWNPRPEGFAHLTLPDYRTWREEAAGWLERAVASATAFARRVGPLLPDGRSLDDGRVMATHIWKWPTRVRTTGESSQFYVGRCVEKHFWDELAALRPRLLLTHDRDAAAWMAERAAERGVELREPPAGVRSGEVGPWALPSDAWGWPMGLLLMREPDDGRHHPNAIAYAHAVVRRVLQEFA